MTPSTPNHETYNSHRPAPNSRPVPHAPPPDSTPPIHGDVQFINGAFSGRVDREVQPALVWSGNVWRRRVRMEENARDGGDAEREVMGLRRVGDVLKKRSEQRICFCALGVEVGGDTVNQKGMGEDIGEVYAGLKCAWRYFNRHRGR